MGYCPTEQEEVLQNEEKETTLNFTLPRHLCTWTQIYLVFFVGLVKLNQKRNFADLRKLN